MLKKLVKEKIVEYFRSEQWEKVMRVLEQGRQTRHMHVYAESVLHPYDMAKIVQGYFEKKGFALQRKIGFLGHGEGVTNIYYVHPRADMAHFELFLNYNPDIVIEPADTRKTRDGKNVEYWDDDYMEIFYCNFNFQTPNEEEEQMIRDYFRSEHWTQAYEFMISKGIHCHVPVQTSIHPETLLRIGKEVIEGKGWSVGKADSVVYSMKGYKQGKITYLLTSPEIVVELDWEFNPDTVIKPRHSNLILQMTNDDFYQSITGIDYYRLEDQHIEHVINAI